MAKRHIEPIARGRVRLRLLEESDLPLTLAWRNQERVRKWFIDSNVITPEGHRGWFERYITRDDDFVFLVEETRDLLKPIGQVAIYNIDFAQGTAEFGRIIIGEPDALRQGLAKEATRLAFDVAFGVLGLRELEAFIKSANVFSHAALSSAGFRETGQQDGLKRVVVRAAPPAYDTKISRG